MGRWVRAHPLSLGLPRFCKGVRMSVTPQVHRRCSRPRRRRRRHPVFARPGRRRVQGLPGREVAGARRPHVAARQDLPHQRLLDVHAGAQAGRSRAAPQHRDRHQLRAHRPRRRAPATSRPRSSTTPASSTPTSARAAASAPRSARSSSPTSTTRSWASARPSTSSTRRPSPTPTRSPRRATRPASAPAPCTPRRRATWR